MIFEALFSEYAERSSQIWNIHSTKKYKMTWTQDIKHI